jgi:intracellular multiplication protein IcmK
MQNGEKKHVFRLKVAGLVTVMVWNILHGGVGYADPWVPKEVPAGPSPSAPQEGALPQGKGPRMGGMDEGNVPSVIPEDGRFETKRVYPSPYIYLPDAVPPRSQSLQHDFEALFGMTPSEILQLRKEYEARQKAITREPAEMRSVTIPVSLQPGGAIPTILVSPGYISAISVIDKRGNPWPIVGVSWGDKSDYQVDLPHTAVHIEKNATDLKDIPENIIHISALRPTGSMGMSILLQGKPTPVVCKIIVDLKKVDARVDLRVQDLSPYATEYAGRDNIQVPEQFATRDMMAFLDGVPPKSAQKLKTDSDDIMVWAYNGRLIVRAQDDLVSPRWDGVEYGANKVRVYQTTISPIILFFSHGETKIVRVNLPEKNIFDN